MTEAEQLHAWFLGDAAAVQLARDLAEVSQLADDLVDRDHGHALDDRRRIACRLLHLALIQIPANPVFTRFQAWLAPLLSDAVLAWDAATELERRDDETARVYAFVWRDQLERVVVQLAALIGGLEHARQVQREAFDYFRFEHPDGQTFIDWRAESMK